MKRIKWQVFQWGREWADPHWALTSLAPGVGNLGLALVPREALSFPWWRPPRSAMFRPPSVTPSIWIGWATRDTLANQAMPPPIHVMSTPTCKATHSKSGERLPWDWTLGLGFLLRLVFGTVGYQETCWNQSLRSDIKATTCSETKISPLLMLVFDTSSYPVTYWADVLWAIH